MIDFSADLVSIVESVFIHSADRCVIGGEPVELTEVPAADWRLAETEKAAVPCLAMEIYQRLYTRAGVCGFSRLDFVARRDHLARLSEANQGHGGWESGWTIRGIEKDGRVAAEKDGLTVWVTPDQLRSEGGGRRVDARCQVKVGKEMREAQWGFYIAIGNGLDASGDAADNDDDDDFLRFYWHLMARGAVPFLSLATARLNKTNIPFRLKVLSEPGSYLRADAGVLYLARRHEGDADGEIAAIWRGVQDHLRPTVPMLTRRLAPGLGVASDPGNGTSFGQHRSILIARGLWRAFERGLSSKAARLSAVAEAFREESLDSRRPHLGPGCTDIPLLVGLPPLAQSAGSGPAHSRREWEDMSAAARRLGDGLVSRARWHQDRCNWMGRVSDEIVTGSDMVIPASAALDCDLYGGTVGVALFLAQLFALHGGESHRRTAHGAMRQALDRYRDEPDQLPALSYFSGWLGIAWATRRIAELTHSAELTQAAGNLLSDCFRASEENSACDLLSGRAGAILVLLDLQRAVPFAEPPLGEPPSGELPAEDTPLARAVILGEEICRLARQSETSWCWPNNPSDPALTGFSHGAAGIGLALLELFAATGREDFRVGARKAFAYEDELLDSERGNWPDLRPGRGTALPGYETVWCHGAPGIALSRLRALQIDPDNADEYRRTAEMGISTTLRALGRSMEMPFLDCSLCHGQMGLAEILDLAGEILVEEAWRVKARKSIQILIRRHGERGDWPSGAASRGFNPSLMLGQAGIGYGLLRLHDSSLPSVLLPGYRTEI